MASLHKTEKSSELWTECVWEVAQHGNRKDLRPHQLCTMAQAAYAKFKKEVPDAHTLLTLDFFLAECDGVIEHTTGNYLNLQRQIRFFVD